MPRILWIPDFCGKTIAGDFGRLNAIARLAAKAEVPDAG